MKALTVQPGVMRRVMNLWPPFVFSGIHITQLAADSLSAEQVYVRRKPDRAGTAA